MAGILVDLADLVGVNKTVANFFLKTYGIDVSEVKPGAGGSGGSGSGGGSGGGGSKKTKKTPMEELVDLCGELVESEDGTKRLEMALKMMKLEKASDCPEDKIPDLISMLAEG